ncbi:hypothetical protein HMPREF3181_01332 [Parvimonas sp. KA00067]|nr:hypothetical protein HMPREF3181_01332 [Parvimonas sp. KA00067]
MNIKKAVVILQQLFHLQKNIGIQDLPQTNLENELYSNISTLKNIFD